MTEITKLDIEKKPWKYIGYRGYAEFISSDDDFYILRRFDKLNARLCLRLQDEICNLEERLDEVDREYSGRESEDVNNGTFRDDLEDRAELLNLLSDKVERYNHVLLQQTDLRRYPRAPQRDVKNIRRWHENHEWRAIDQDEQRYLDHDDDLICVFPKERTPIRRLIESSLWLRTLVVWKKPQADDDAGDPSHALDNVTYYSTDRMDKFASGVIVTVGVTMLIAPLWILQGLSTMAMKLTVITVFVSVFLIVLSFAMVAKPFEALGATAAYAAVLMVFVQIGAGD